MDKFPILKTVPVIYDVDFGHTQPIFTFPLGGVAEISTDSMVIQLLQGEQKSRISQIYSTLPDKKLVTF